MPGAPQLVRCSPGIRALGVDPIGSAVVRTSFLLVDHALPWAKDIGDDEALAPLVAAMRAAPEPWRLQGVVPADGATARRVVAYELPAGGFTAYERREIVVESDAVVDAALALLGEASVETDPRGDLLVCTHGRRDTCCGSSGTSLWQDAVVRPDLLPDGVRLCRTSHTGGHRFAPTAILLPAGTCWAWLDVDLLERIVGRAGEFADVAPHFRGSTHLASMEEQVVERAVAEREGWAWFDRPRTGRVVERDGERTVVELHDGDRTWTAETRCTGTSPVPDCPGSLDEAPKSAPVIEVVHGSLDCRF